MIIKSVAKMFTPGKCEATKKIEIITSTDEGPIALKFKDKEEMLNLTINLLTAMRENHDILMLNSKGVDYEKFIKGISEIRVTPEIKFAFPTQPTAKKMKQEQSTKTETEK